MDKAVIKFYRKLLSEDFPNSGELENAVFVESIGQKLIDCGNTGNYMQLYIRTEGLRITDIKYVCSCEPVANVAVEVLCGLVKGKTLDEATGLTEEPIYDALGSRDGELQKKVKGLLALLNEGIEEYKKNV